MSNKVIYKKYISSKEWKEKKEEVFNLRGKECEQCGYKHRLHVHHLTYENLGNENMEDLQILCYLCHMSKHEEYFDKLVLKGRDKPKGFKELQEGEIRLTQDHLDNLRTKRGGLNVHVHRLFGYSKVPKKKGWFSNMLYQPINEEKYLKAVSDIRKWDEEKDIVNPPKQKKNKTLKHKICNDLRKQGIRTINGDSISYMDISKLQKLHQVYC